MDAFAPSPSLRLSSMTATWPESNPASASPRPRRHPIRVLLATPGWPSGILEVGSHAARQPSVEVTIFHMKKVSGTFVSEEMAGPAQKQRVLSPFSQKLQDWQPHVVGFRVEGEPFEPIRPWIQAVRDVSSAEVVLGGPTATSHPIDLLDWSGADYVFAGEAEQTFAQFLDLARRPNSRDLLPEIPGIAYRFGDRTFHNTLPTDGFGQTVLEAESTDYALLISCLRNAIRPIASKEILVTCRLDWSLLEGFQQPFDSLYFTGGRGCPGACSFCAKLHGTQVRIKSAEQLLEEIERAHTCVTEGRLQVTRWPLFAHVDDDELRTREVSWAAIYDEDFFLNIPRAIQFFELWSRSPLNDHYRISLQTNPCSMLTASSVHPELIHWIDRVKPMVQLGAESFNSQLLTRWHKRHDLTQLNSVLDALDTTRQDYTVFQLLTDFDTTAEELIETLRLLILAGFAHPRMRIASSPYTIPLYDTDTRKSLDFSGRLRRDQIRDFRDYERPHPEWMDPLVAALADLADERLHWTLNPETRDGALSETMPAVVEHLKQLSPSDHRDRDELLAQALAARDEIAGARFQFRG